MERQYMKKFFESGVAFMVVALISYVAAMRAENGSVFMGLGAFWLIMAIIVRSRNAKKSAKEQNKSAI
jgi:hypothetical protein